jgi:phage terminase large subunit-like protein
MVVDLVKEGVPVEPFGQGFGSMNAPTKEFEKLALEYQLRHGGDPVLKWALGNVTLQYSPSADIKVAKDKSHEKVDPVVATIMAIGQSLLDEEKSMETEAYKDRGFTIL